MVDFYEKIFGPFPFEKVAIAEVAPEKGIAGVSLPGLILLSSEFFSSRAPVELSTATVEESFHGPLVIADEISHQYNFYATALPNALAEGLAQYTDTLYAEHLAGHKIVERHFEYYSRLYRGAVATARDEAILSQKVYGTAAYMAIVFSKGACILQMLRDLIGDEKFFSGLKTLLTDYRGHEAGLSEYKSVFGKAHGSDLGWFFEQWYMRSGYPHLKLSWKSTDDELIVTVRQTQGSDVFRIPLRFLATVGGKAQRLGGLMREREQAFAFQLHERVTRVVVDPAHLILSAVEME